MVALVFIPVVVGCLATASDWYDEDNLRTVSPYTKAPQDTSILTDEDVCAGIPYGNTDYMEVAKERGLECE